VLISGGGGCVLYIGLQIFTLRQQSKVGGANYIQSYVCRCSDMPRYDTTHPVTDFVETVSHADHSFCISVGLNASEYSSLQDRQHMAHEYTACIMNIHEARRPQILNQCRIERQRVQQPTRQHTAHEYTTHRMNIHEARRPQLLNQCRIERQRVQQPTRQHTAHEYTTHLMNT